MSMKKYNLTNEEKEIVCKFRHYSIPFLFKSGKYCGYLQYFEFVDFEICEMLLNGTKISEDDYKMIISEDIDYNIQIKKEELDKNSLEFYNLYLLVKDIVKKYYK